MAKLKTTFPPSSEPRVTQLTTHPNFPSSSSKAIILFQEPATKVPSPNLTFAPNAKQQTIRENEIAIKGKQRIANREAHGNEITKKKNI